MGKESATIYFVRHGETDWNKEGLWQGHTDIPLNAAGRSQALQLKKVFSSIEFEAALASDLSRACETAELIIEGRNLKVNCHVELREITCKPLEGKKMMDLPGEISRALKQAKNLPADQYFVHRWHPEVETPQECIQRVTQVIQAQTSCHRGLPFLIVSHGGVIRFLLDHFNYIPGKTWKVSNGGYLKLNYKAGQLTLQDLVDIEHISMP